MPTMTTQLWYKWRCSFVTFPSSVPRWCDISIRPGSSPVRTRLANIKAWNCGFRADWCGVLPALWCCAAGTKGAPVSAALVELWCCWRTDEAPSSLCPSARGAADTTGCQLHRSGLAALKRRPSEGWLFIYLNFTAAHRPYRALYKIAWCWKGKYCEIKIVVGLRYMQL